MLVSDIPVCEISVSSCWHTIQKDDGVKLQSLIWLQSVTMFGSGHGLINVRSWHLPGGTGENHDPPPSQCPSWDSNQATLDYKLRALLLCQHIQYQRLSLILILLKYFHIFHTLSKCFFSIHFINFIVIKTVCPGLVYISPYSCVIIQYVSIRCMRSGCWIQIHRWRPCPPIHWSFIGTGASSSFRKWDKGSWSSVTSPSSIANCRTS